MKGKFFRPLIIVFMCFLFAPSVNAQKSKSSKAKTVRVKSYTTKKGKTVKAHKRSKPSKRRASIINYPGTERYWKQNGITDNRIWVV